MSDCSAAFVAAPVELKLIFGLPMAAPRSNTKPRPPCLDAAVPKPSPTYGSALLNFASPVSVPTAAEEYVLWLIGKFPPLSAPARVMSTGDVIRPPVRWNEPRAPGY